MELFNKPTIEIICYTAGLFDGEGSIYYIKEDNRFGSTIAQAVSNNGEDLAR